MDEPNDASARACPWCSARLAPEATVCPSCGAILTSDGEPQIPGVTTVIPAAPSALTRAAKPNRLMRWISGEPDDSVTAPIAPPGSLEPPATDVRREIRKLEIEAELTNLSAEASSIAADDALEAREANDDDAAAAALQVAHDARAVAQAIDRADAEAAAADPAEIATTTAAVPADAAPAPEIATAAADEPEPAGPAPGA